MTITSRLQFPGRQHQVGTSARRLRQYWVFLKELILRYFSYIVKLIVEMSKRHLPLHYGRYITVPLCSKPELFNLFKNIPYKNEG